MHIVFQTEDVKTLLKSFELDESLRQEIVEIKDDYAVGPIQNIYAQESIENRKDWWRNVLSGGDYNGSVDNGLVDDQKAVEEIIAALKNDENENAWIWVAPNKHDVSGYYWLMSQLKDYVERIYVLHLNNLPFINEKGSIFYPVNLSEIPPKEFIKAKKLARQITPSEFELDPDEWIKLGNENKSVRILEGAKKLSQHDEDYFDQSLLTFVTPEWQKAHKVISQFLSKAKQTTGDAYMLWRVKYLVASGIIEAQGELKNMKDFEVKKRGVAEAKPE